MHDVMMCEDDMRDMMMHCLFRVALHPKTSIFDLCFPSIYVARTFRVHFHACPQRIHAETAMTSISDSIRTGVHLRAHP